MKSKSLRQLARELGVSASYLSQVKNGKRPPSEKVLSNPEFKVLSIVKQQIDAHNPKRYNNERAGMAELADAEDLKSSARKSVWVRPPLPAPPKMVSNLFPILPWLPLSNH
jgi:transcriptional regulator with XRE-family HTH domain